MCGKILKQELDKDDKAAFVKKTKRGLKKTALYC